jgi:hypothetical protein
MSRETFDPIDLANDWRAGWIASLVAFGCRCRRFLPDETRHRSRRTDAVTSFGSVIMSYPTVDVHPIGGWEMWFESLSQPAAIIKPLASHPDPLESQGYLNWVPWMFSIVGCMERKLVMINDLFQPFIAEELGSRCQDFRFPVNLLCDERHSPVEAGSGIRKIIGIRDS